VRRRPVTLSDVARAAGVSKSTVSNVVRGASPVAPETRSRVEDAVRELGYRPNGVARALREKTSTVLGLIVPDAVNPFYGQLALGVERRAHVEGYGVLIANTECDPAIERAQLDALVARRVDGVLVGGLAQGSMLHVELLDRGIPVVCAFPAPPDDRLGLVDTDDERAMGDVVDHLHALGHRRCAFASHGLAEAGAEARQVAFEDAAKRRGIAIVLVINNNSGFGQGWPNIQRQQGNKPGDVRDLVRFGPTNFADVARVFGLKGIRVEDPSQIQPALKDALASDETVIVDVATDIDCRAPEPWLPPGV